MYVCIYMCVCMCVCSPYFTYIHTHIHTHIQWEEKERSVIKKGNKQSQQLLLLAGRGCVIIIGTVELCKACVQSQAVRLAKFFLFLFVLSKSLVLYGARIARARTHTHTHTHTHTDACSEQSSLLHSVFSFSC